MGYVKTEKVVKLKTNRKSEEEIGLRKRRGTHLSSFLPVPHVSHVPFFLRHLQARTGGKVRLREKKGQATSEEMRKE